MAERTVYRCDRCGADDISPDGHVFIATGRQHNGVDYDTLGTTLDLCQKCLAQELVILVRAVGQDSLKASLIERSTAAQRGRKAP